MRSRGLPYPVLLLAAVVWLVVRRVPGQPAFRGEFIIEDCILLLTVVLGLVPARFKPLITLVIGCSTILTLALLTLAGGPSPSAIICCAVFLALAICAGVRRLSESSRARRDGS